MFVNPFSNLIRPTVEPEDTDGPLEQPSFHTQTRDGKHVSCSSALATELRTNAQILQAPAAPERQGTRVSGLGFRVTSYKGLEFRVWGLQ